MNLIRLTLLAVLLLAGTVTGCQKEISGRAAESPKKVIYHQRADGLYIPPPAYPQ